MRNTVFLKIPDSSFGSCPKQVFAFGRALGKVRKEEQTRYGITAAKDALRRMFDGRSSAAVGDGHISIEASSSGKPVFSCNASDGQVCSAHAFDFSISHSGDVAGASVSDKIKEGLVGFDIEKNCRIPRDAREAFLTLREKKYLEVASFSKRKELEVLFWCIKEAFLKAVGMGLKVHPRYVEISPESNGKFVLSYRGVEQSTDINWGRHRRTYIWSRVVIRQ